MEVRDSLYTLPLVASTHLLRLCNQAWLFTMGDSDTKSHSGSMEKGSTGSAVEVLTKESSQLDLLAYHEHNAGRLVIDPECVPYYRMAHLKIL